MLIFICMKVGTNIRKYRKAAGLTQVELGELLGLSQNTIANYEKSERKPDIELMPKIAAILNVNLEEIYGLKESKKAPAKRLHGNTRTKQVTELFEKIPPNDQRSILKHLKLLTSSRYGEQLVK